MPHDTIAGVIERPVMPDVAPSTSFWSRSSWWLLGVVLLVALIVRGGALWALRSNLEADPDSYRQLAENLLATGSYSRALPLDDDPMGPRLVPTAYRPVLYPLLLALCSRAGDVSLVAVGVVHLVLGLLTVALVFDLALRWRLGQVPAALAALLVAADPILVYQSSFIMTETLATLLAVGCWWQLSRWGERRTLGNLVVSGVLLGLAILCRPTFLPWAALVMIAIAWHSRGKQRVLAPLVLALAMLATLSPWLVRNYVQFGRVMIATTHGGYTLWLANNPLYYDWLRSEKQYAWPGIGEDDQIAQVYWKRKPWVPSGGGGAATQAADSSGLVNLEFAADDEFRDRAKEAIRAEPGMFVLASLVRVRDLWSPLPQKTTISESTYRTLARYVIAIWYVGLYLLAATGAWHLRDQLLHSPWIWGLTLCLAFTAVHAVYWSNLRMRAPLIPVVALLAVAGCGARNPNLEARNPKQTRISKAK